MSNSDFGGFWAARARADHADAASAIADWERENQRLRKLLENLEEKLLFRNAEFDANNCVLKLALEALQQANPSSPLLDKRNRDMLRRQHIAATLAPEGYNVDVGTGQVAKKR